MPRQRKLRSAAIEMPVRDRRIAAAMRVRKTLREHGAEPDAGDDDARAHDSRTTEPEINLPRDRYAH